jgi:hypothetical protein
MNQDGLKLNGTHQLLAYADDVNILGGSVHTVKENADVLVVATKEIDFQRMLRVFENRVLRRVFGPKKDEGTGNGENYIMRNLVICIPYPILCGW